jgi:hypothetical protein
MEPYKKLPREFTPKQVERMLFDIYIDMKSGKTYEDKACKETYVLNSILKAQEVDVKMKRLEMLKKPKEE